jgi:cyclomaltodextrinase
VHVLHERVSSDPKSLGARDWLQHAIFWHLYPLGFTGAEPSAVDKPVRHRLQHIEGWLDYAVELGCSGLLLGPIFASQTHGYDTLDHLQIDARLGDQADFERLVAAAHGKGLKLVLDGVFNHVGRGFPRFKDAAELGERSAYAHWFKRTGQARDGQAAFAVFEGHGSLVALNHAEPEVASYVTQVMDHWLARGADGFRLDAAYAVPPEFWQRVLPELRRAHAHAFFLGEVIHGDYARIAADSGMDSVTQYELWKAIWSAFNDVNCFELAWALERHAGFVERFLPQTFVGNHDVTRIASKLQDTRHLPHALVCLLTLPGIPSIYAGDEQAFRGIKEERAGGDDAIRPAFPAQPAQLAPYGWPTYRLHQDLISLRRRHPFLQRARVSVDQRTNPALIYTCEGEGRALTVALNLSDAVLAVPMPLRRVLSSSTSQPGQHVEKCVVEPHGYLIGEPR